MNKEKTACVSADYKTFWIQKIVNFLDGCRKQLISGQRGCRYEYERKNA